MDDIPGHMEEMMNRDKWLFEYRAGQVLAQAKKMLAWHEHRHAWWAGENETAVKTAKDRGMSVKEFQVSGGVQAQMQVDPLIQQRLNQTFSKMREHEARVGLYKMWCSALAENEDSKLRLDAQDLEFFGFGFEPVEAED